MRSKGFYSRTHSCKTERTLNDFLHRQLIGAFFEFRFSPEVGILVGILLVGRIVSYSLPLPVLKAVLRLESSLPFLFGLCFLSSGGVGVAFAVSLKLTHPLPLTDIFLSAALVLIIVSEILGPVALRISLGKLDTEEEL